MNVERDKTATHLEDDALIRLLGSPLGTTAPSEGALEEHLSRCARCRERLDQLAGTAGAMGMLMPAAGYQQIDQVVAHLIASSASWLTGLSGTPALARIDEDDIRKLLGGEGRKQLGRLGSLNILKIIGQGGMGVVLLGHDRELDREVAIKLLHPAYREAEAVRDQFRSEAKAIAALNHENVIPIHHVAEDNGLLYFVMPLAEHSLSDWLRRNPRASRDDRLRIAVAAAKGLAAAHSAGIAHRDIKPGNLLMPTLASSAEPNKIWLADFGLARRHGEGDRRSVGDGTPGYVAPEILDGREGDLRSDLFSLGVLFDVLFPKGSAGRPEDLIRRLTAENPADRPASAGEVVAYLERQLSEALETAATIKLKRRFWRAAILASVVLGLPAGLILLSDLALGTGWINAGLGKLHRQTVFAIKGRIGISRGLRLMLNEATDGDTIEVIGGDAVEVAPLILKGRTITIRSAGTRAGARPVLKLAPDSLDSLIWVDNGNLTLEGLELTQEVHLSTRRPGSALSPLIRIGGGNLTIVNCRITRTGSSRDNPPFLVLSRQHAPVIRIVDSELVDPNGTCVGRSSFKPAPKESIEIENSRFFGKRWLMIDPPSEGRELPEGTVPEIDFRIRNSLAKAEVPFSFGPEVSPETLQVAIQLEGCGVESSGPFLTSSIGDPAELLKLVTFRMRGTVFAPWHQAVHAVSESPLAPIGPGDGDLRSAQEQWQRLFGPGDPDGGLRWVSPPLFEGDQPSDWVTPLSLPAP